MEPPGPDVRVIVPAVDEETSIGLVLAAIPRQVVREVVVVDNGSLDRTADVARAAGATVLHEPRRGYGSACLAGIRHLGSSGCGILVVLDADLSDHPEELPLLIDPIVRDRADLVIGSRTLGTAEPGALPPHVRMGNALATSLIRILFGHAFTDMGPFRAIRFPDLLGLEMADPDFGWNVEMQIKAIRRGLRILEVPVRYRRRVGVSKISGTVGGTVRAGAKIIGTILWEALKGSGRLVRRVP